MAVSHSGRSGSEDGSLSSLACRALLIAAAFRYYMLPEIFSRLAISPPPPLSNFFFSLSFRCSEQCIHSLLNIRLQEGSIFIWPFKLIKMAAFLI